ncbi:MAG: hypothetical protein KDD60_08910 [Bdellovibrionales bacterium]|nr:hypothetical protein [Bdellovibrionales bacterium]
MIVCSVGLSFSGCAIFVPVIDSYKSIGVQRSDRERLLNKELVAFNQARFWGPKGNTLQYVDEKAQEVMIDYLREQKEEKIVESQVDFVTFQEDAYEAKVSARVKFYRVPYYVVEEREESQSWVFSLSDGWKIRSIETVHES